MNAQTADLYTRSPRQDTTYDVLVDGSDPVGEQRPYLAIMQS